MQRLEKFRFRGVAVLIVLVLCTSSMLAGEGFGRLNKKTAKLTRVHPPQVFIAGTKIAVRGTSQGKKYTAAAERLGSKLESEIVSNDPRFKIESSSPETVVEVNVLRNDYTARDESRRCMKTVDAGKDSKGKQQYKMVESTCQYRIVNHEFSAAFKVLDVRSKRTLVADTIANSFHKEFLDGTGAPDQNQLEDSGVDAAVKEIVHRVARTSEVIGVLLPRGSMDDSATLAEAGLWSKYLDALEKRPPLAKPLDEAYRQYGLGVAYEALGYGAEDVDTTLKYLEQASIHYNNAIDTNPAEDYFSKEYESLFFKGKKAEAPLTRVQAALTQYQKLKEFAAAGGAPASAVRTSGAKDVGDAMTNASVIEMLSAGLPDDVILGAIDAAPATAFDVTPAGLIQLSKANASKKVIMRVQSSAAGKGAAKSSSGTPKSSKK